MPVAGVKDRHQEWCALPESLAAPPLPAIPAGAGWSPTSVIMARTSCAKACSAKACELPISAKFSNAWNSPLSQPPVMSELGASIVSPVASGIWTWKLAEGLRGPVASGRVQGAIRANHGDAAVKSEKGPIRRLRLSLVEIMQEKR